MQYHIFSKLHYKCFIDMVLLITRQLRRSVEMLKTNELEGASKNDSINQAGNQAIFVEFFGPSVNQLSISDRSAVANLCTEYGATVGYFPVDETTLKYLRHSGRDTHQVDVIELYMKRVNMFRDTDLNDENKSSGIIQYDSVIEVDLSEAQVTISGPKKSKERILLDEVSANFTHSLAKLYNIPCDRMGASMSIDLGETTM